MKKAVLLIGSEGYIGSYLYGHLRQAIKPLAEPSEHRNVFVLGADPAVSPRTTLDPSYANIDTTDIELFGMDRKDGITCDFVQDYRHADSEDLQRYDVVLWFAGHSSVRAAGEDPDEALDNNCLGLLSLRQAMRPGALLVYASSGSVYSKSKMMSVPDVSKEGDVIMPSASPYDMSKFGVDYLLQGFHKNCIGLRMGTVSGWSPRLREDLVFNAMNLSAIRDQVVRVRNGGSWRSVLFLDHLCTFLRSLLHQWVPGLICGSTVVNVATFNTTIRNLGQNIARAYGARVDEDYAVTPVYSFRMDTAKMDLILGSKPLALIPDRCGLFAAEFSAWSLPNPLPDA